MAVTPKEAYQQAYNASVASGEEQVAVFLKQQYQNLTLFYPSLAIPEDDSEYRRMAGGLIDNRQFNAKTRDGQSIVISIDDLDSKDAQHNAGIRESLGVASLSQAIPTREQLHVTADAIGDGVESQTGTIGFLGGATIMNALNGLMQWIFSGFKGGFAGLKSTIAEITASEMRNTVGDNLIELRNKRPDMHTILTDQNIIAITDEVRDNVREQAGLAPPREQAGDRLAETTFVTLDDNQVAKIQRTIRSQVLHPDSGEPLQTTIANKINEVVNGATPWRWGTNVIGVTPGYDKVNEMSGPIAYHIADTISTIVTNPNFRDAQGRRLSDLENPQEFAAAVAQGVTDSLIANKDHFDLPPELAAKLTDPSVLQPVQDTIMEQIVPHHNDLLSVARRVSADNDASLASAAREAMHPDARALALAEASSADHERANISTRDAGRTPTQHGLA